MHLRSCASATHLTTLDDGMELSGQVYTKVEITLLEGKLGGVRILCMKIK